jgi:hypothetical protein
VCPKMGLLASNGTMHVLYVYWTQRKPLYICTIYRIQSYVLVVCTYVLTVHIMYVHKDHDDCHVDGNRSSGKVIS